DKAIKAHGGEEKLTKYQASTSKIKGKVHVMGMDLDVAGEVSVQLPDRMRVEMGVEIMGMKFTTVQIISSDKAWTSLNGMTMDLDKDMVAEGKEGMHALRVTQLVPLKNDQKFKLKSLGESKVGDRTVIGIQVSHEGHRDVNLYLDKEKGLLLKSESR